MNLDRNRRTRLVYRSAVLVIHRAHATEHRAGEDDVAALQRAGMHEHRRNRTAPLVEPRFDDDAFCGRVTRRFELEHFRLQQDRVKQRVDALSGFRRDGNELHITAVFFWQHAFGDELLLHAVGIGFRLVDLVDRHDDRHVARLRVGDRFLGLRHDAVVGGHHQHDDVCHLRAACAHRGERFVARRIEERDLPAVVLDLVGADVLRDPTSLGLNDGRLADCIE